MEAPTVDPFRVSLSAVTEFRKCEQSYFNGYVRKLRKKTSDPAPTLGRILHDYLATFYNHRKNGVKDSGEAHHTALAWTLNRYSNEISAYQSIAAAADDKKTEARFDAMPTLATNIATRYYVIHGRNDWDRYEILHVERPLTVPLTDDIISVGIIDLVARDTQTGNVSIWEHKSSEDPPHPFSRLRDLQTLLYKTMIYMSDDLTVDSIVWNNLRTKPPTVPDLLQRGGLSRRKDMDTTWHVYLQAIRQFGLEPNNYRDVYDRLKDREEKVYFMRHEQEVVTDPRIVLGDYIADAKEMMWKVSQWNTGELRPVRNLSRSCDYCAYNSLCMATITGGDERELIEKNFIQRGKELEATSTVAESSPSH